MVPSEELKQMTTEFTTSYLVSNMVKDKKYLQESSLHPTQVLAANQSVHWNVQFVYHYHQCWYLIVLFSHPNHGTSTFPSFFLSFVMVDPEKLKYTSTFGMCYVLVSSPPGCIEVSDKYYK